MKTIKIDTKFFIKETKYIPMTIIKSNVKEKSYFLFTNFNPIAQIKKYDILVTIVKRISENIKDLEKDISVKIDDKLRILYKPENNRLMHLMIVDKKNYNETKYNGLVQVDKIQALQTTKSKSIVHTIYEYNKAILFDTVNEYSSSNLIESNYNDLITIQYDNFVSLHSKTIYDIVSEIIKQTIERYIDLDKNVYVIKFNKVDKLYFTFIRLTVSNNEKYLYNESFKPIQIFKTEFEISKNDFKNGRAIGKLELKGFFINRSNPFSIIFTFPIENFIDNISIKYDILRSTININIIKNVYPLTFGSITDNVSYIDVIFKSLQSFSMSKAVYPKHQIGAEDNINIQLENTKSSLNYAITKNLQPAR